MVQIIVFAEYGLYPLGLNRDTIRPFLEEIPSPEEGWNPEGDISDHSGREILFALSQIAKHNGLFVVANMGDVVPCTSEDPHCPPDGR